MAERPEKVRRQLLPLGRMRRFNAQETVFRIGDTPDGIYGVISGQVSMSAPDDAGSVFDCMIGTPGFWIGDLALLAKCPRLVTVTALTDIETWFLPQQPLLDALRQEPELLSDFYALNHTNMEFALRLLANMAIPDSGRRLAAWLLFSADNNVAPEGWIDCSQEQISLMNGLSLPTVRRVLKRLEGLGLVELGYGQLRVRDTAGLSAFCSA